MAVIVSVGAGDRQGPDIVDELVTSEGAQVARGRGEINENSSDRVIVTSQIVKRNFVAPGLLGEVIEGGRRWRGKVVGFSRSRSIDDSGEQYTVDCNLEIERVRL